MNGGLAGWIVVNETGLPITDTFAAVTLYKTWAAARAKAQAIPGAHLQPVIGEATDGTPRRSRKPRQEASE